MEQHQTVIEKFKKRDAHVVWGNEKDRSDILKSHYQVDESKKERAYLKSPNTVRYLSHTSRVNEP